MFVYTIDNTITGEYLEFTEGAEPFVRQCWEKVIADPGKLDKNANNVYNKNGLDMRARGPLKARCLPHRAFALGDKKR